MAAFFLLGGGAALSAVAVALAPDRRTTTLALLCALASISGLHLLLGADGLGLAELLGCLAGLGAPPAMTLWPLLRLGALSADLGLRADRLSLPLAVLGAALALAAGRAGRPGEGAWRRGAAGLPLLGAALLTLLGDNLLLLCAGW